MPPNKSQEEFLNDLNTSDNVADNIMDRPLTLDGTAPADTGTPAPIVDATGDDDKGNRRERRLQQKLQAEREAGIALAARLEALTESAQLREGSEAASFEKLAERIYGNQTPENAEATSLLVNALKEVEKSSTEKALSQFREEQRKYQAEVAREAQELDGMIEDIEDEHNITLDEPTQKAFFQLLNKLSPKDKDGEIVAYADHQAVWEELKSRKQAAQPNRAKDIASRSMSRTGAPAESKLEDDSVARFLKSQGWEI